MQPTLRASISFNLPLALPLIRFLIGIWMPPIKPKTVDAYLANGCGRCAFGGTPHCKVHSWTDELALLRGILHTTALTEELKWSAPCYTHNGKNIVMLSALKEFVVVSFFRGAELQDPEHILEKPGENSRFARYVRFTDGKTITARKKILLSYIQAAITLEQTTKRPTPSNDVPQQFPDELIQIFRKHPAVKQAFSALTPGRQRGYLLYFSSAKQSATRTKRIESCIPNMQSGKGWNER